MLWKWITECICTMEFNSVRHTVRCVSPSVFATNEWRSMQYENVCSFHFFSPLLCFIKLKLRLRILLAAQLCRIQVSETVWQWGKGKKKLHRACLKWGFHVTMVTFLHAIFIFHPQNNKLTTRVLLKNLVLCLEICNKKKTAFKSLKLVLTDILCCWVYLLMLERRSVHCIEVLPRCSYHISSAFGIPLLSRAPQTSKGPDVLLAFCSLVDEGNHSVTWRFISCKWWIDDNF